LCIVTTIAGTGIPGNADGPATQSTFHHPMGLTIDPEGNLYVSEAANNRIRKISASSP